MMLEKERLQKVQSILVSQPEPQNGQSPYDNLKSKYGKIYFREDYSSFVDELSVEEINKYFKFVASFFQLFSTW